jgi:hypothetical protein
MATSTSNTSLGNVESLATCKRQALYPSNISYILYVSDSSGIPVTKLTTGLAAVQFSVGLRYFYLLLNVQTAPFYTQNHIQ